MTLNKKILNIIKSNIGWFLFGIFFIILFRDFLYTYKIQLEKFRSGDRANDMNAMMRNISAKLTDAEISALSQYVGGLH